MKGIKKKSSKKITRKQYIFVTIYQKKKTIKIQSSRICAATRKSSIREIKYLNESTTKIKFSFDRKNIL